MAKKPAQQQTAQEQAKSRQESGMKILWTALIMLLLIIIAFPTVMLVFFAMLPSVAAYVSDSSEEKYSTFSVGGMNFAGTFPYLMDLWAGPNTFDSALGILDVFTFMVMYGSAGFGLVMFLSVPPVVVAFLTVMAQRRVVQLRTEQREIIKEWGEEVAATDDLDEEDGSEHK